MVLVIAVQFAVDGVTGTAVADAVGAASLCHESGNDAVKLQAVVEAVFREFDKVGDCVRCVFFKEFHGHGAAVGRDFCVHDESIAKSEKASPNTRGLSCGHCQLTFEIRGAIVQELECRH